MVDGKCAYTLLLPAGKGEGACPKNENTDSENGEMSQDIQQTVTDLHRNFTQLLSMYTNQATMLNKVYSTLMDKLLSCHLLQECTMVPAVPTVPDFTAQDFTVPTVDVDAEIPTATIPTAKLSDVTLPDIKIPNITMPDVEIPGATLPDKEIPGVQCDICPDLDTQLQVLLTLATEIDRTVIQNVANISSIFNQIRYLNETVTAISLQILMNGGGSGKEDTETERIPNVPKGQRNPPIPDGGLPGRPQPNPEASVASVGHLIEAILNSGALCLRKGPLVSGEYSFLPDISISASSVFNYQHVPVRGRIYSEQEGDLMGAWCPGISSLLIVYVSRRCK